MKINDKVFLVITILTVILMDYNYLFGLTKSNVKYIRRQPIIVYADLNADNAKEKIIIVQNNLREINSVLKANVSITVYKNKKIVYNHKEIMMALHYAYVVKFPIESENSFRDIIFLVTTTGRGVLKINFFSWETKIKEMDVYRKATSKGNIKFKGHYRLLKTDFQLSGPYD